MSAIALTAAQIAPTHPETAELYDLIAAEAITAGQAVYLTSTGKAGVADANAAGKQQFRGIATKSVGAGQPVSILKKGHVGGFTVSGMAYDAPAYLSDTAGALDTAAGTMTVPCGRVTALSDPNRTKVLYIDADWITTWA